MTLIANNLDPNVLAHKHREAGDDWSDKHAAAEALERAAKRMKSECFLCATGNNEERKAKAETNEHYQDFAHRAETARRDANKARVKYDVFKAYNDNLRTMEATNRAEMQMR